jgi:hypothetical protein
MQKQATTSEREFTMTKILSFDMIVVAFIAVAGMALATRVTPRHELNEHVTMQECNRYQQDQNLLFARQTIATDFCKQ